MQGAACGGETAVVEISPDEIEQLRANWKMKAERAFDSVATPEAADAYLRTFTDSFSCMGAIVALRDVLGGTDWLRVLGRYWSRCDNIREYRDDLQLILGTGQVPEMMTTEELEFYQSLPSIVTIYRGCSFQLRDGASWSVDRNVANSFPFLNRYRVADPVLITATVRKNNIVAIKLDRDEVEVITFRAEVASVEAAQTNTEKAEVAALEFAIDTGMNLMPDVEDQQAA